VARRDGSQTRPAAGHDALPIWLDARGDGGYIVAAPSHVVEVKKGRTWDGKYQWLDDRKASNTPVADAPVWLLEAAVHARQAQTQVEYVPRERREGDGFRYGHKALDAECQEIMTAVEGGQDNQIVSSAFKIGQLVAGGEIPREDAEDALINASMAIPGQSKTLDVISDKVRRAMDKGATKPRQAPARPERSQGRPALRVVGGSAKPLPKHDPETGELLEEDEAPPEPTGDRWFDRADWAMDLRWSLKADGGLQPTSMNNLTLMFENHPQLRDRLSLNRFSYEVWIRGGLPCDDGEDDERELSDNDEVALAGWLNRLGLKPGVQAVGQVLRLVASRRSFDPVEDYLLGLKWDGKARLDSWLTKYAGVDGGEYTRSVGAKFAISAVARVLEPGCKVDTMLVLEGPQGLLKSTLARALFGSEWFSDQVGDVTSKESQIQIQGLWCIEVEEMDQFSRADASAVKSFLSRREDRYRPPYGRGTIKRPRRCVFIGTINPEGSGWIKDATGGRRYWPVLCTQIDVQGISADRDQLWAEAVSRYRANEPWWLSEAQEREAKAEQSARQTEDLWDRRIQDFLNTQGPSQTFTNSDVVEYGLALAVDKRNPQVEKRVGAILTRLKCTPARATGEDGKRYRAWLKPLNEEDLS
jgi:predicted P-loop ATPase